MSQAIVMVDTDGNVTYWDATAEQFFGHRSADVLGRSIEAMVPEEFREQHRQGLRRAMSGGERHLVGAATHLPVLHADGTVVCHGARFNHITTGDNQLVAAVAVFGPPAPDAAPWTPIGSIEPSSGPMPGP
jgi:PAS domain S-box-containing protein